MTKQLDAEYLREQQYRDASNLEARIRLHALYSTNQYGWPRWMFDHIHLPENSRVLEVGCGQGLLWTENATRVPEGCEITLSDRSQGMARQARDNIDPQSRRFRFMVADAQSLPFPDAGFDAVIANHMLYHVPGLDRALKEIRRVLKPGGTLYASTMGRAHMKEMDDFSEKVDPRSQPIATLMQVTEFSLESGGEALGRHFEGVQMQRYPDALEVTNVQHLVEYAASTGRLSREKLPEFARIAREAMEAGYGVVHITKDSGLFAAQSMA